MNVSSKDREHQEILDILAEMVKEDEKVRDALLGTYDKKGLVSRVRSVERYIALQWGVLVVVITAIIKDIVLSFIK